MKFPEILVAFRNAINSFHILEVDHIYILLNQAALSFGVFFRNYHLNKETCVVLNHDTGRFLP